MMTHKSDEMRILYTEAKLHFADKQEKGKNSL